MTGPKPEPAAPVTDPIISGGFILQADGTWLPAPDFIDQQQQ